tara:strand:- start:565 stop:786 length:222 start_codon:yes stop_codon:yes gene_type:complete
MPKYYIHYYDFCFEVISKNEDAEDVTPEMIYKALILRANSIWSNDPTEFLETCGRFETVDEEEQISYRKADHR